MKAQPKENSHGIISNIFVQAPKLNMYDSFFISRTHKGRKIEYNEREHAPKLTRSHVWSM